MISHSKVMTLNDMALVPSENEAVRLFKDDGGNLTIWSPFGEDPIRHSPVLLARREEEFNLHFPDISVIFHKLVNGDFENFKKAIQLFISVTESLNVN